MTSRMAMDSPIGVLGLHAAEGQLTAVEFDATWSGRHITSPGDECVLHRAAAQLTEYFAGKRRDFELPLAWKGTAFQQQVWRALCQIPFGATKCYGDIATEIGNPKAVRAVGLANGKNPLAIIVPCHRVIGCDGTLTGYGGGLDRKKYLLALEGITCKN